MTSLDELHPIVVLTEKLYLLWNSLKPWGKQEQQVVFVYVLDSFKSLLLLACVIFRQFVSGLIESLNRMSSREIIRTFLQYMLCNLFQPVFQRGSWLVYRYELLIKQGLSTELCGKPLLTWKKLLENTITCYMKPSPEPSHSTSSVG